MLGEQRPRCRKTGGSNTWTVRAPPEVTGGKWRNGAFQSSNHSLFPDRRGHEEVPNPVRNTDRTQASLTRRVPSRRRPPTLCARRQRRGWGQPVVTGDCDCRRRSFGDEAGSFYCACSASGPASSQPRAALDPPRRRGLKTSLLPWASGLP